MPYIDQEDRHQIKHGRAALVAGELNYVITKLLIAEKFVDIRPTVMSYWCLNFKRYQTINDIIGALECAKLEYRRRMGGGAREYAIEAIENAKADFYNTVAAPYEDGKVKVNGDVY